ncbi:MAG TPA: hypothetical protein VLE54_09400 [Thermoanaerobaculia bacterium]|nr:hypothetical protein [Thermoanaerobaculia bacterium]
MPTVFFKEAVMRTPVVLALLGLVSSFAVAQSSDVPLTNWTVPPYRGTTSADAGLSTMADVTPGIGFVGVAPCRLVDTRQAGFPAGYGTPALSAGVPRNFDLNSDPLCTGIPASVDAYSLNITVTNTQGPGFILIYPQGGAQPPVSTVNYVAGQTIANAAVVPAGTGGGVTVIAGVSGTDLIIDINGYFTDQYNAGVSFHAVSSTIAPAILAENTSQLNDAIALHGVITSTNPGANAAAVRGTNNSTSDKGVGVLGVHNGSAYGVWGISASGFGVVGQTTSTTAKSYGVFGRTFGDLGNVGVLGIGRTGAGGFAGLPGANTYGVIGASLYEGVRGALLNGSGAVLTYGSLGFDSTTGVFSSADIFAVGNVFANGAKPFVDPHPLDPTKEIAYVALEGPEAGTYFRGRGKFQRGMAVIPVPESFRLVSDSDGLTVQVTPVGEMATVAVVSLGLDRIVVRGSRDVEFFYTVNGVRKAFKDWEVIRANDHYIPEGPEARMPHALAPEQRRRLIATGIYNEDDTVNMETARRLGWDKEWRKRSRPAPKTTSD